MMSDKVARKYVALGIFENEASAKLITAAIVDEIISAIEAYTCTYVGVEIGDKYHFCYCCRGYYL